MYFTILTNLIHYKKSKNNYLDILRVHLCICVQAFHEACCFDNLKQKQTTIINIKKPLLICSNYSLPGC